MDVMQITEAIFNVTSSGLSNNPELAFRRLRLLRRLRRRRRPPRQPLLIRIRGSAAGSSSSSNLLATPSVRPEEMSEGRYMNNLTEP